MIPTLGLMIAAYIGLRCVQLAGSRDDTYRSRGWAIVTQILAVLTALWTGVLAIDLVLSGARTAIQP